MIGNLLVAFLWQFMGGAFWGGPPPGAGGFTYTDIAIRTAIAAHSEQGRDRP